MINPGVVAWTALAAGVVGYNIAARDGQMLSQQADRWIERHPIAVRAVIAVIAAHVANAAPARFDPVHAAFTGARRLAAKNKGA